MSCLLYIIFLPVIVAFSIIEIIFKIIFAPFSWKKYNNSNNDKFNKEADFWGLSDEDRRIAKQERMSPADYIESLERDDDNLDTDE